MKDEILKYLISKMKKVLGRDLNIKELDILYRVASAQYDNLEELLDDEVLELKEIL